MPAKPDLRPVAAVYDRRLGRHSLGNRGSDSSAVPPAGIDRRDSWPVRLLLALIRLYQRFVSPVLPAVFGSACGCRFSPTCSHYAAEAVQVHGPFAGAWLALRRLVKCSPLHPGGVDPPPPRLPPSLKLWRTRRRTSPVPRVRPSCDAVLRTGTS
ncbi:MAG: membrane protein insertion efficiency factor YidD [Opitutaceae bacterium]|nr:membrane protein insertion efficiency factor YidD [Opitutaceae bacterium]